jgi:hypothetical protein
MLALMAAMAGVATPVKFELQVPQQVVSGEKVQVRLVAKNTSDRPVVLTELGPIGSELGARLDYAIERGGAKIERDARGNLIAQWVTGRQICEKSFIVLQPGESSTLMEETFANQLPQRIRLKTEWQTMPRTPLPPGMYTARAKYSFYRTFNPKGERSWRTRELTPAASRLYHQTWTGTVNLNEKFEVVAS